jgi:hypothetical protein
MTVEDFMRQLSKVGQSVGRMELHLLEVSSNIVNDMIARAPKDTGSLKDSIKNYVENHRLRFTMLYYGPFQNYGVLGSKGNRGVADVEFGVLPRPAQGTKYKFKNVNYPISAESGLPYTLRMYIREQGLKPQNFFDIFSIRDKIQEEIQIRLDNLQ